MFGRRRGFFFLRGQIYTSGSTFIEKIEPLVCHFIGMASNTSKKDCKTNCFVIGSPSVDY